MIARPTGFMLERVEELSFRCDDDLAPMYKLSPYVWYEADGYHLFLRVVNADRDASKKVARVHAGRSADGLQFVIDPAPAIAPSSDPAADDSGGCEDPTVARVGATYYVYYTGWNERRKQGSLLLAAGPDLGDLVKRGVALASTGAARNPKEATIVRAADGRWLLFFEFARENRSWIGAAEADDVGGPWRVLPKPLEPRAGAWDDWHLSPGPVVETEAGPVMFYNGATDGAAWRVGWVRFDPNYGRVIARGDAPLIEPGDRRSTEDTDIVFAASAVLENERISLYYSIADRYCMRATIQTVTVTSDTGRGQLDRTPPD